MSKRLSNLKPMVQRAVLEKLAMEIKAIADEGDADEVQSFLETLQDLWLEPLSSEDYFGTEGWERWMGLD